MPVATYSATYSAEYFSGVSASSSRVPGLYDIAIDGHEYLINKSHDSVGTISAWFREETPDVLRAQADQSNEPGEQSISPQVMWRRSQESWHKGAGQRFLDRDNSDRNRFRISKNVNVWTRWEMALLNRTQKVETFSGGSNTSVLIVNSTGTARAYASSGASNLRTSPDPLSTWSNVTGIPATNCTSLATDGRTVYSAWGTNGIYSTDSNATPTTAASYVTGTVALVAFIKNRLIAASLDKLYEITAGGALPTSFFDHPNANWVWTGLCEGGAFLYASGKTGSYSTIYSIKVEKESTALAIGQAAITGLPPGETIESCFGALGLVFLGTNRGVRMCIPADDTIGSLTVGGLIPTPAPVYAFANWDRFVYFTWTSFDATSSGLGRIDPSIINTTDAAQVPAYASDIMASTTGAVHGVAILPGTAGAVTEIHYPLFTIDGSGVWRAMVDTAALSGELRTGQMGYGIVDYKAAAFLDLRHKPLPANSKVDVSLTADDSSTISIGTSNVTGSVASTPMSGQQKFAELFELVFVLTPNTDTFPAGPTIRRWTLRAIPAPSRPSRWTLPLIFKERLHLLNGATAPFSPDAELDFLRNLKTSQRVVALQLGKIARQVLISDLVFLPDRTTGGEAVPTHAFTGTVVVTLSEISG